MQCAECHELAVFYGVILCRPAGDGVVYNSLGPSNLQRTKFDLSISIE
jgi:hypothetical protein